MSAFLTSTLALIITLGLLIAFHEFGHYWTARRLGVKVLRYSIGFGKPLWKIRRGPDQTEYVLAAFPIGGYVKMLDEREVEVAEEEKHRAFNRQPVWSRFTIVAAGPIFNLVFAVLAFWLMYLIGVPGAKPVIGEVEPQSIAAIAGLKAGDEIISVEGTKTPTWDVARINLLDYSLDSGKVSLKVRDENDSVHTLMLPVINITAEQKQQDILKYLGITPYRPKLPAVLGQLEPGGPAEKSGLKANDRVLRLNNQLIADWLELVKFIRGHPGESIKVEVERKGEIKTISVTTDTHELDGKMIGRIGAAPAHGGDMPNIYMSEVKYPFFKALAVSVAKTWQMSTLTLKMIGEMIIGQVSVDNLSGPITIATYAGYSASIGFTSFLYFLAVVSISLGILNLLPIPMLDGGHLMYYLVEIIRGRPLSDNIQIQMQRIGIAFLVLLMTVALYNDISRLFGK
jgi:regulator of sigma E protease